MPGIPEAMEPELREIATPGELESAKSVRYRVFVSEQEVPPEIEMDEHDANAVHVICLVENSVVGTGRLVRMPDGMKLGRVAVLPEYRGMGLGTRIVKWLLERAEYLGPDEIYANVQIGAREFYEKLGFKAAGGSFMEAGIEHVRMARRP